MTQQGGTVNFVIQDTNGNPQYIKVQKTSTTKTLKPVPPDAVKALLAQKGGVTQVVNATSGTVLPPGSQVLRALVPGSGKARQLVTIPVQTPIQSLMKPERQAITRPVQISTPNVVIQPNIQKTVSVADSNNKRKQDSENDFLPDYTIAKRRKADKCGKGLRHFSMKVCEKVRRKGITSYNEVADELVAEFTNPNLAPHSVDQQYDQKNIRRRVYDALNVLMAMNIISKEKKEIRWLGLPTTTAQECVSLITEKKDIAERIKKKTQQLNDLLLQQISYKNLIQRNYELEKIRGPPPPNSAIQLPFIVVNSDRKTVIDCSISNDKTEYLFVFNDKFEIHDDFEILKQIGLTLGLEKGAISESDLSKVKSMLPKTIEKYIDLMAEDKQNVENDAETEQVEFIECAGPSSDGGAPSIEDPDSTVDETSDEESNLSTDIEIN